MSSPSSRDVYSYRYRGWDFPTFKFALTLHDAALAEAGGLPGVKDENALLSALEAPVRSAGGVDAYFSLLDKIAALGYLIARNHPFNDANKRTSLLLMRQTVKWNRRGLRDKHLEWSEQTSIILMVLLGSGQLSQQGLKMALALGLGMDPANPDI